jgi:hypothetical protein
MKSRVSRHYMAHGVIRLHQELEFFWQSLLLLGSDRECQGITTGSKGFRASLYVLMIRVGLCSALFWSLLMSPRPDP